MKPEAEEDYFSVSDILGGTIHASAVFVVDSSRMTRILDPAEAV
jgi:hypothetical protein